MRKIKGNLWNQFNTKMSQKVNKLMNPATIEGIDIDAEYQLILTKKSKLSANMREAVEYHFLNKNLKKEEVKQSEV